MTVPWAQADIDVDALIDSADETLDALSKEPWAIRSLGEAEWATQCWAGADSELGAIANQYEEWKADLVAWIERASKTPRRRKEFFELHLSDYLRRERAANPRTKSIPLPSGTLTSRLVAERVVVEDQQAVLAWLHTLPEGREVIAESVRVSELRRIVAAADGKAVEKSTGEVVAGLAVEPESLSVTVRPARETGPA